MSYEVCVVCRLLEEVEESEMSTKDTPSPLLIPPGPDDPIQGSIRVCQTEARISGFVF
jgi:hypothetical protein